MAKITDIVNGMVGKRFGRLVVISFTGNRDKFRRLLWECKCDCGNYMIANTSALRSKNTTSCGCYNKEVVSHPYGMGSLNKLFYVYKRNAERRKYEFLLTLENFIALIGTNCYYCGSSPSKYFKNQNSNGGIYYNGIDRLDNDRGYVLGNCVPCCSSCNYAKRDMSYSQFKDWVDRVSDHLVSREILSSYCSIGGS